ncbi:hypothetical protein ES703_83972 [subsurface metagenome]
MRTPRPVLARGFLFALKLAPPKKVLRGLDKLAVPCYYSCVVIQKQATDFMTVRQAAKQIGVHFTTVYRWIYAGRILNINFGGILFIPESEVGRLKNEKTAELVKTQQS